MNINEKTRKALLRFQQNEITESLLYTQLAAIEKDPSNKEVLLQIANDEKGHYTILKKYTGQEISPNKLRVTKYYWLARILGITFAIKLMEGRKAPRMITPLMMSIRICNKSHVTRMSMSRG